MVKRYGRKVGHPELHPHSFRHSYLTRLVEWGANIKAVQALAGHENLQTTSAYLGLTPKHLEEAVRLLDREEEGQAKGKLAGNLKEHYYQLAPDGNLESVYEFANGDREKVVWNLSAPVKKILSKMMGRQSQGD